MSNYTKTTNFASKDNLSPGNPLKIVKGTEIDTEFNNIATAVATKTDNASANITGGSITGITDLAIADGGTGASTATAALNNLLPSQSGNANKYLQTDGTNATWDAVSLSTSDITGTLPVANGGTGVTTSTGTGAVVLSNSPTLVTPALGTPSSGTATNLTGLPISTGVSGLGTGVATFLGTPSSANLASAVTDETGSGALVFANSPTLVTPTLGTPASATLTNATGLPIGTGVSGLGTGVATALAVNVGSSGAPLVNGGVLGTPSSGTATNLTGLPISTGVSGLGTGVATALAVNVGSAGAPVVNGGALGTPSSGTATNLTGLPLSTGVTGTLPVANGGTGQTTATAAFNALAPSQATNSGKYLTTDGTNTSWATVTSGSGDVVGPSSSTDNALVRFDTTTGKLVQNSVGILSDTGAISGLTDISASGSVTLSGGTANGVTYLNGSKVLTSGSTLSTDGTNLALGGSATAFGSNVSTLLLKGTGATTTKVGTVYFKDASSADAGAIFLQDDSTYGFTSWNAMATGNFFRWAIGALGTETMRLTSTGLGIGTSSPNAKIEAYSATAGAEVSRFEGNYSAGGTVALATFRRLGGAVASAIRYNDTAGAIEFGTTTNHAQTFITNSTERMRLDASGNLALGTTSAGTRLVLATSDADTAGQLRFARSVDVSYYWEIGRDNNSSGAFIFSNAAGGSKTERARIDSSGNLLVGTTSVNFTGSGFTLSSNSGTTKWLVGPYSGAGTQFYVCSSGSTGVYLSSTSATSWASNSDERLKDIIEPISNAANKVSTLRAVIGKYKTDEEGKRRSFLIAQDVQAVLPEAVSSTKLAGSTDDTEYLGVAYTEIIPLLVAAIQEQQAIIQQLQADVAALKG